MCEKTYPTPAGAVESRLRHADIGIEQGKAYRGDSGMGAKAMLEERARRARQTIEKCGIQIGESSREADELEALVKELPPLSSRADEALYKLLSRTM